MGGEPPVVRVFWWAPPAAPAWGRPPAQKDPPVPVNTATDAASSASKARNASYSFRAVAPSTALRQCGRLMETMVTGPSRSTSTVSASVMERLPVVFLTRIVAPDSGLKQSRSPLAMTMSGHEGAVFQAVIAREGG